MAVPKQRQSHSRTNKRRSQHKVAAPGLMSCPRCHAPRLPHRVCPNCGTYAGREVVVQGGAGLRRDLAAAAVIALDANGADRGPAVVAQGAAPLGRARARCSGPPARARRRPPRALRGRRRARSRSPRARSRCARCARSPRRRSCRRRPPSPTGRADALVSAGSTGPTLAAATLADQAPARRAPAGARRRAAGARPARCCCSTAARTSRCGPSTSCSSPTWARASWRPSTGSSARASACCRSARSRARAPRTCWRRTSGSRTAHSNFVGNVEGFDLPRAGADVIVDGRLHRQRRAEGDGGDLEGGHGRDPRGDPLRPGLDARRAAGPRPARAAARAARPRGGRAARSCSGCASRSWSRTAASVPTGIASAMRLARRAVDEDMVGRTAAALAAARRFEVRTRW